jgi:hypothetical protein
MIPSISLTFSKTSSESFSVHTQAARAVDWHVCLRIVHVERERWPWFR